MKTLFKRGLTLLMVLALCVSLVSGLSLNVTAATVNYVTNGNYVYNWGTRGETATFLSPMAEEWYADQGTTYSALSSYSGASSTSSVPSSALYTELASLMTDAHDYKTSYDATKDLYQYTDCQNSGGKISSFYSGSSIGPEWGSSPTWNREHTWPNSKGLGGQDENDIMMLRPTAESENSSRGNTAYGQSSGYYNPNSVSSSKYDLRGDVARIVLYVYVRWGNTTYMWGQSGVMESKAVLIQWMEEDPVDTWELGRNDAVEAITGTRNVFVDYPELGFLLFDEDIPDDYTSPSNEGANSAYSITATSNNTSYGTVSLSGSTITATPNTGYYAAGYTVKSGSATVSQSGNTFRVSASSDCSIQINFAAKTAATVTFMEDGTVGSTVNTYLGDPITLPSPSNAAPLNHTFIGWVTAAVKDVTEQPTVLAVGSEQTVSATTYYALYSYEESDGGSGGVSGSEMLNIFGSTGVQSGDLESIIWTGENFTFVNNKANSTTAIRTTDSDHYRVYAKSQVVITPADGRTITKIVITATDSSYVSGFTSSITNGTGSYSGTTVTIVPTDGTAAVTLTPSAQCRLKTIEVTYGGGGSTTTYYTTTTCDHSAGTTTVAAQDATCTEAGYTAGQQCNECGAYVSGHDLIAALDHNYIGTVTAPTETAQGYTTYVCSRCDASYVGDYKPALGVNYTVSFSVPDGVTAVADMTCNSNGSITLPSAGVPTGEKTYTFAGWVESSVDNVTDKPAFYAAGEKFTTNKNVTLIALYTYAVGGSGTTITNSYTVSDYTAGVQYADNEEHVLDSTLTVFTTQAHWTSELRLYSSNTNDGFAIFQSTVPITGLTLNIGYKSDTLNVYGSNDNGLTWTLINAVSASSTYADKTVDFAGASYAWLKLDVAGTNQLRIKNFSVSFASAGTTYYTTVISGSTVPDEPEEENFLLSFRVPNGVTQPKSVMGNSTVELKAPAEKTVTIGTVTYTFVGWVKENCKDVTAAPDEVYAAGAEYPLTANTVLYALYTYNVKTEVEGGASESGNYVKVEEEPTDWSGEYLIVYEDGNQIFNGSLTSLDATNNYQNVTISDKTISAKDYDSYKFIITAMDGGYSIQSTSGYYIGNTSDTNALKSSQTTKYVNILSWNSDMTVDIKSAGTFLRFNSASDQKRFRYYKSNTYTAQKAIVLYKKVSGGSSTTTTTYYTTNINSVADLVGATVTLGDTLGLNFHTLLTNQYQNATSVQFTFFDERQNAYDTETVNISDDIYSDDFEAYLFTLQLPAVYMATTVKAVLYYDGQILDMQEYSIRTYAMAIIDPDATAYTAKEKATAKAMLNYGTWAQNYFGYSTDDLANSKLDAADKLTDTDTALASAGDLTAYKATITDRLPSFIGYTLLLKDVTSIRLYFTEQVTVTVAGVELELKEDTGNNRYYAELSAVNAAKLDDPCEVVVNGTMTVENLSVLSLASMVAEDTSKSTNFRNAMIALILYAQSVNNL